MANWAEEEPALAPHFGRNASKRHDLPKCGASRRAGRRHNPTHAWQDPELATAGVRNSILKAVRLNLGDGLNFVMPVRGQLAGGSEQYFFARLIR